MKDNTVRDLDPSLRNDCLDIWKAGVAAIDSRLLVCDNVVARPGSGSVEICGKPFSLSPTARIVVVGAGKAGAGMAAGFEEAVGSDLLQRVSGFVNVPADCIDSQKTDRIQLHAARPAGLNEPTQAGVDGTCRILETVRGLNSEDLCVVLISGGGSALLPAPVDSISLADKQVVTRVLMQRGATIQQLNCVRKQLSAVKGGRLAQACSSQRIVSLIISDVIGDPLDVIASGPTVADSSTPQQALEVLQQLTGLKGIPDSVVEHFKRESKRTSNHTINADVSNFVIGNNELALKAAGRRAEELGYNVHSLGSDNAGIARDVGCQLFDMATSIRDETNHRATESGTSKPVCILSGGEPTVELAKIDPQGRLVGGRKTDRKIERKGGRNQELVLAAVDHSEGRFDSIAILSGGTDGEDGPTDAAGAVADSVLGAKVRELGLSPGDYLATNNSYPFFEATGGLIKTGPTHTNVMDLRVVLVR